MRRLLRGPGFYLLLLIVIILVVAFFDMGTERERLTYPQLLQEIKEGKISHLRTTDRGVVGLRKGSSIPVESFPNKYDFESYIPYMPIFDRDVRTIIAEKEGLDPDQVTADMFSRYFEWNPEPVPEPSWIWNVLPFIFMLVLVGLFWFFFIQQAQGGGGRVMSFGKSRARLHQDDKHRITFNDVAGAEEEKHELQEIVEFLKNPRKFIELGARIPKGVLLVGPPGTGKTLLAKAVAGEAGVPFFSISGSDFVEMFVGVGASRVRDLFDQAKKSSPCIVFIDEIDAVGRHRGAGLGGGHDEREQTLNQLLVEMDGFAVNEGIIILAATNRPDILDPALLRPGRFDRRVVVGVPDVKGRAEIIKVHSRGKPLSKEVDIKVLAKRTPGFTGADIENMMNEAAILAARRNAKEINMDDIEEAINRVIAGPEKKSKMITEKDKKLVAYHESGHAVVAKMLPNADPVHQVSIVPRGMAGGYTLTLPKDDKYYVSRSELMDEITMLLGGRVAEGLVLEDISTGASNDLQRATKLARRMVMEYGMSEDLGPVTYGSDQDEVFLGRDFGHTRNFSEDIASKIDVEVKRIVKECYDRAEQILRDNIDRLHRVANALLEKEKLEAEEFEALFANEEIDLDLEIDTADTEDDNKQ
ncbi:MAG TPA: ATP-dependent zinc metalloprotease FtsH [Candidatus Atribacteria bacterium]|nr:ATP-dependent zinc metalloprotease FtsH [Candidatus Atribacteria bacterium]